MLAADAILYVDNHLLAVVKPAGLPTQVSAHHDEALETRAKEWLAREYAKPGKVFLEAVHRLDRPVGGVVLFARTSKALSRLQASIREKDWEKVYLAVVDGVPPATGGAATHYLRHRRFHSELAAKGGDGAREATLRYRVVAAAAGLRLLEVHPATGRYHQIRAQLAALRCPILGDVKYGGTGGMGDGMIALHHVHLAAPHPVSRERIEFHALPPACWPWTVFADLPRLSEALPQIDK